MEGPEQPLTRAGARAWARALTVDRGEDPGEVSEVVHEGFGDDPVSGGFAFRAGRVLLVALRDGAYGSHLDPGDPARRLALVDRVWDQARRRNRVLAPEDLGPHQRAALAAVRRGVRRVAALEPGERPGVGPAELPGAEWLLMALRRAHRRGSPTEREALATLSAADGLLAPPGPRVRVHPCPICRGLAPWTERYPRAVCRDCGETARCVHGQPVTGHNVSFSGGFEAVHGGADAAAGACAETTATGAVRVAGWPCRMGEARFGGIVVQAEVSRPDPRDSLGVLAASRDVADLLAEVSGMPAPPLPAWAGEPVADVEQHLRRLAEHLVGPMARSWCREHPGSELAARVGLLRLVDPAWAPGGSGPD